MKSPNSTKWLTELARQAKALREAGVLRLETENLKLELAPPKDEIDPAVLRALTRQRDEDERQIAAELDPLLDRATYGGRGVPSFRRPESEVE